MCRSSIGKTAPALGGRVVKHNRLAGCTRQQTYASAVEGFDRPLNRSWMVRAQSLATANHSLSQMISVSERWRHWLSRAASGLLQEILQQRACKQLRRGALIR